MNRLASLLLVAALLGLPSLLGLSGCGGPAPAELVAHHSFELSMSLVYERDPGGVTLPGSYEGVLRLDDQSGGTEAVLGADGSLAAFALGAGETARERALASGDSLPLHLGDSPCGGYGATLSAFTVELLDADADGEPDGVRGTAEGSVFYVLGDVGDAVPFTATFTGSLDETPPEVSFDGAGAGRHVLDGIAVRATEPLAVDTSAHLSGGGLELDLPVATEGGVALFRAPSGTILPFDADLALSLRPSLSDLAGNLNSAEIGRAVRTMSDPGLFAEDGFEGAVSGLIEGAGVSLVSGVGDLGALEGSTSLFVSGAGRATFVLPLEAGDETVRFRYRRLFQGSGGFGAYYGQIVIASEGADPTYLELPFDSGATVPTGDGTWTESSEVLDAELPIPAGASGPLFVDFRGYYASGTCAGGSGGAPIPEAALLVDELRAE